MRDYAKVGPKFWTGRTGRLLRAMGSDVRVIATYAMTSPHANMIGLYFCPLAYIAEDTGISIEGVSKALQRLSEVDFCVYDEATGMLWVLEMARFQVGEALDRRDKRVVGIAKEYAALPNNPFLQPFFERYSSAFCMPAARTSEGAPQAPVIAPSKPRAGTGERTGTGKSYVPPPNGDGEQAPKGKKVWGNEADLALARRIYEAVKVVAPSAKEPNWDGWANAIRLMREQDERSHEQIWEMFDWANRDTFWRVNVLSPSSLRDRWTLFRSFVKSFSSSAGFFSFGLEFPSWGSRNESD